MRLTVALLISGALAAQTAPAPPAPDSLCAISGQAVNAVTGEPLHHALVSLRRIDSSPASKNIPTTRVISTDAAGGFAISGIQAGTYDLFVERSGFIDSRYGARGPNKAGMDLILERGQKATGILFRLTPHSAITGRVLDEDGEPVADVQVTALHIQYGQGRKKLSGAAGGSTNDLGEYRLFGLAPGRYYIKAVYRPRHTVSDAAIAAGQDEYVSTFYPRTADAATAAPLDLTAGSQLRNIHVTLVRLHTVRVKGRVVSEVTPAPLPGRPATPARVSVMLNPQNAFGGGHEGQNFGKLEGDFEFRKVVPGTYVLFATELVAEKRYGARMTLPVGAANIEGLTITIHAPVITVAGHVKVEGETVENLSLVRIGLQPFETDGPGYYDSMQALKSDGSFQLSQVSAEHYRVYVDHLPEGFYVKSIRTANVDAQVAGLDLRGGAPAPVEIVLSPNAGQLTGTVLDSKTQKPVSAVMVVLVPQEKDRRGLESYYKAGATDQAGHFTFKNLVPGEYKVFSWEDVGDGAWMDPDFLAPYESRGEPVTIREGSPQSIQVTLIADL